MKKSFETLLHSTLGVAAVAVILVVVNFLYARIPVRFSRLDLTAEKAYTLSAGTRAILAKLDTPVQIRFYCTRGESMPPQLKLFAQNVEDLLNEYRQASHGQIEIQKLNPEPDSDAEDSARLDGVEGQLLPTGEKLFLGLSVSMLDQKEVIPFLGPDRERLLEYDLSRALTRVTTTQKPVVGVMSSLPIAGQAMNMMLMQMGQRGEEPWAVYSELKRDFTVREVPMTSDVIPEDVKVLLLVHPKTISEATEYALDQFVLRGGKLIACLDPAAVLDRSQRQSMMGGGSTSSTLDRLLKAWGITFEAGKTVADLDYLGRTQSGRAPGVLMLNETALSKQDILTAGADNLFFIFPGAFSGTPVAGLKETVLIRSSSNAQLVEPMTAQMAPEEVLKNFVPAGQSFPLAIRLTGKFKTAFPEGKPKQEADAKAPAAAPGLKESKDENSVVLIGDSDFLQDPICVTAVQNPFTGGRMLMPANGNLALVQGAVEQMAGDDNLIAVRGRATRERPFTVVKQMEAEADAAYRTKIKALETSLAETQSKLNELQQHRQGEEGKAQKFILTPEQQAEIAKFRQTEADVKKQLKEVRRNLRAATDALENRVKWLNIAGMPLLVALSGLGFSFLKRKRTAAQ